MLQVRPDAGPIGYAQRQMRNVEPVISDRFQKRLGILAQLLNFVVVHLSISFVRERQSSSAAASPGIRREAWRNEASRQGA
jgi:hypothetical protein